MFKYYIYKFGQFCVNRLSLKWAYRIAVWISDLQYTFSFRDRRAVKDNLRTILPPDADLPRYAREVFRNFGRYLVEFFRMGHEVNREFLKQRVTVDNLERVRDVMRRGKGAIFLTAHIGNWELGGAILSKLGYPTMAIALPHKERPVNELFNNQREAKGFHVVSIQEATRKCIRALANNEIVSVLADRDFTHHGKTLKFLGRMARIPKGPAIFSFKTGAPIVPMFLIRNDDGTFTLQIEEPFVPPAELTGRVDQEHLVDLMQRYAGVIEKKIQQYPGQWLMFRRFWME